MPTGLLARAVRALPQHTVSRKAAGRPLALNAYFVFQSMPGLRRFLAAGDIVVATDYPRLGTAGPHPYLIGVSEGRAVLDAVRAARLLPDARAGYRLALWGHSPGGQAALSPRNSPGAMRRNSS
jgi:hypothetical protein